MTSPKQRAANQANAQQSTGPTTPEGRARSSQNAFKNGLASGRIIIDGEDIAEFQAFCERLAAEHQPLTETEIILVQAMAKHHWLENRAQRLQTEAFANCDGIPSDLPVLIRYETTHHRAFHKSLDTLLKLKKQRPQPEIGFVSQTDVPSGHARQVPPANPETGFVSQKPPPTPTPHTNEPNPPIGFVSQNASTPPTPYVRPFPKISRNAPCPCRSGKKFKRCCLGKQAAA